MRCVDEIPLASPPRLLTLPFSSQPRCPACNHGPFTERHILELQDGGFQKKPTTAQLARRTPNFPAPIADKGKGKGKAKAKPAFTVSTVAASSSQDSKSSQTVLTILDSSDEEDSKPATPKKKKPVASTSKGKGKRPAATTDEDSDYDDEPPPSVKKGSQFMFEAGSDTLGDMDSTDEEDERERRKQEKEKTGPSGEVKGEKAGGGVALFRNDFKSSTKLDALVASLNAAREKDPDLKAVVFSQVSLPSSDQLQES
jgi:DNA repair protein RAD5